MAATTPLTLIKRSSDWTDAGFDLELVTNTNVPPTVTLFSPGPGAEFDDPANILLSPVTSDVDGVVLMTELFQNGLKLGEITSASSSLLWTGVPVGSYPITAVATDNTAARGTSAIVTVAVVRDLYTRDGSDPGLDSTITSRAIAYDADFLRSAAGSPVEITVLPSYSLTATTAGGGTTLIFPAGLVSWWSAEVGAVDLMGSNHGSRVNGAAFAPGVIGSAFTFDGIDDGIVLADSESLKLTNSLTIEGWIWVASYPRSNFAGGQILVRGDDRAGFDPYSLSLKPDGMIHFQISSLDPSPEFDDAAVDAYMPTGRFTHVAATLDDASGNMRLYLAGELVAETVTLVRPFRDLDLSANPGVGIGNHGGYPQSPHNQPFHGLVDELRIYSRALTSDDIRTIATTT